MAKPEWLFGLHTVTMIVERFPERVLELYLQVGRDDERTQHLRALSDVAGFACKDVDKKVLDGLVEGNHQGVAARCRLAQPLGDNDLSAVVEAAQQPLLFLVLDAVTDPHNMGACIRTAAASGAAGVIAAKDKTVGLTPVVRRVAVGTAELMPFYQVTNLVRTLKQLQQQGVWVVGAALDRTASSVYDADLCGHVAMVMGAEGKGMRRLTQETCDSLIYIPMQNSVDSLNVSVAAGVCLFEAQRQRMLKSVLE